MISRFIDRMATHAEHAAWSAWLRFAVTDERGGGRNTDEGFHISAGAVLAGTITAAAAAFIAKKLGVLG